MPLDRVIQAAILCGGQGTRLRSVLRSLPKCLAPVRGRPFLDYILTHLVNQGVQKAVLCLGYGANKVMEKYPDHYFIPNLDSKGLKLEFSMEEEPLGTGGALKLALPLLSSDPVLVLNGDTFCPFDLELMWISYQMKDPLQSPIYVLQNMWRSTGVRLIGKKLLAHLPEGAFDLDRFLWGTLWGVRTPFLDIGTPDSYELAEKFLMEQGLIKEVD